MPVVPAVAPAVRRRCVPARSPVREAVPVAPAADPEVRVVPVAVAVVVVATARS